MNAGNDVALDVVAMPTMAPAIKAVTIAKRIHVFMMTAFE
jgi:hypothetical protein